MDKKDLLSVLKEYSNKNYIPMHMPGAKRSCDVFQDADFDIDMGNPYSIDITEIDGFDNMHNAKGIIKDAFDRTAKMYGADESLFLINGSTSGNLAAISGTTFKGDKVLVSRNCHVSVYNAIYLNELNPVYIYPDCDKKLGIYSGVKLEDVKNALQDNEDIKAVIITSPTYEGNVSEVREIVEYLHSKGIPLIVDEAHGAHLHFHKDFPESAVDCGADIVINSVHKTLPSLTQTAVMHINYGLVNVERVKRYWNIYQSTSPSYVLMASIDRCMSIIESNGEFLFNDYVKRLNGLRCGVDKLKNIHMVQTDDISKIVLACDDGHRLYTELLNGYNIQMEMSSFKYVIAMTSICDTPEFYQRFLCALEKIDEQWANNKQPENVETTMKCEECIPCPKPKIKFNIADALNKADKYGIEEIKVNNVAIYGKISAGTITIYPPGIPLVNPGEVITKEVIDTINSALETGLEIIGIREGNISCLR